MLPFFQARTLLFTGKETTKWQNTNLSISDDGSFEDSVHTEDGGLWHVDDRGAEHRPENAAVGDGEGTAVHVLDSQLKFEFYRLGLGESRRVSYVSKDEEVFAHLC